MSKSDDDVEQLHPGWTQPLGRTRAEADSAKEPPGPVFDAPPPDHPLLQQLHALWISATDDSIGSVRKEVAGIAAEAPDSIQPWVRTYLDTFSRLELWLRDH